MYLTDFFTLGLLFLRPACFCNGDNHGDFRSIDAVFVSRSLLTLLPGHRLYDVFAALDLLTNILGSHHAPFA